MIPRRRKRWIWVATVVALLSLAAGGTAIWATRDSGPEASTGTEQLRPFVDRIENVLTQSAEGRREVASAIDAGVHCRIPNAEAARRIDSVADNRQSILQQLGTMTGPTSATDRMVTLLQQGLQHSIEADRHYRDAFLGSDSCPLPRSGSFKLAAASDRRATTAKELFVARFDPVATKLGERAWTAQEF